MSFFFATLLLLIVVVLLILFGPLGYSLERIVLREFEKDGKWYTGDDAVSEVVHPILNSGRYKHLESDLVLFANVVRFRIEVAEAIERLVYKGKIEERRDAWGRSEYRRL